MNTIFRRTTLVLFLVTPATILFPCIIHGDTAAVSFAIAPCIEELAESFTRTTGEKIDILPGQTRSLSRQMAMGAPYDLFLAAENRWPAWLEEQKGITDSEIFAYGYLVLWSGKKKLPDIQNMAGTIIAVPEPEAAATGLLARNYFSELGLWQKLESAGNLMFVRNIPQAVLTVTHGPAEAAFISLTTALQAGEKYHVYYDGTIALGFLSLYMVRRMEEGRHNRVA